jgi:hypothetical protein
MSISSFIWNKNVYIVYFHTLLRSSDRDWSIAVKDRSIKYINFLVGNKIKFGCYVVRFSILGLSVRSKPAMTAKANYQLNPLLL